MSQDRLDGQCAGACPLHPAGQTPPDPARRRFLSATLVVSVGAFLAGCGDGIIGGVGAEARCGAGNDDEDEYGPSGCTTTLPIGGLVVTLASFPALAVDGGIARVDGGTSVPIAAVRVNATTYRAFSMACTHAGTTVTIVGNAFSCPNHGAQFSATGAVTRGPATTPLREYAVVYGAAGGTLTIT